MQTRNILENFMHIPAHHLDAGIIFLFFRAGGLSWVGVGMGGVVSCLLATSREYLPKDSHDIFRQVR